MADAKALLVFGGWEGHKPQEVSRILQSVLRESGYEVESSDTLDTLTNLPQLREQDLVVSAWNDRVPLLKEVANLKTAIVEGVGFVGLHGICDSFRSNPAWQMLLGGIFGVHGPANARSALEVTAPSHPITKGLNGMALEDELYYVFVDPAVEVLATFRYPGTTVDMPAVWVKHMGKGRLCYCSLGHGPERVIAEPTLTIVKRACAWAARAKEMR